MKNRRSIVVAAGASVLAWVAMAAAFAAPPTGGQADEIRWRGAIGGIEFVVTFVAEAGGGYTATLDIPVQGLSGGALTEVVYTEERIAFTLPIAPPAGATWTATRQGDGTTASGTLEQGSAVVPFSMEMLGADEPAGPLRPQTPAPPFPYAEREVGYTNAADGTVLAATLTIPAGDAPFPAALLITGSGPQDRDASMLGHQPFLVIADHLSRNGIAVLRADDRGVGGSGGAIMSSTPADFAADVLAGVALLKQQAEIDADKIGLIGHSEGGIVAPLAAAQSADVAFIVLLAGPGMSGRELMPLQLAAIARTIGRPESNISRQVAAQENLLDLAIAGADRSVVRAAIAELSDIQIAVIPEAQRPARAELEAALDAETDQMLSPWFRGFLTTDPRDSLRLVRCPVLALNGSLDTQVPVRPNLESIGATLSEAGNGDYTTEEIAGLNHLFQTAETGSPSEYALIDETFSPAALEIITDWILARTRRPIP